MKAVLVKIIDPFGVFKTSDGKLTFATFFLAISMLATGASGLVTEYVLSTVSTYILGSSIEQFSITIALMLLMMGIASWAQKFFSDENLIEKFIIVEILLAILGGFAPIAMYMAFGFLENHFLLVQYFFILSIGFLIGFEIPLILRINEKFSKTLRANIAVVSAADYIGSFLGAWIWVKFLLKKFPLTEIGFILAILNFGVAVITCLYFMKHGLIKNRIITIISFMIVSAILWFGFSNNRNWNISAEQKLYEDKIVFTHTTKYQHLVMTYRESLDEFRFYINGNLQFSSLDEKIYHEQLVHPVMSLASTRKNVLILGGGDGLALREVLKYSNVENISLIDIDYDMVNYCANQKELFKLNKDAFKNAKVNVIESDGVICVDESKTLYQETGEVVKKREKLQKIATVKVFNIDADKFAQLSEIKWDVIIVDLPDPNSVELAKLYSRGFYRKLNNILSKDGIISVQSTSPYHAKEAYLCIGRTIESADFKIIPYHDNVPSFGDWGWYIGYKNHITDSIMLEKIDEVEDFRVETDYLTPELFKRSLVFGKKSLISKHDDISTLMYPVILERYIRESWLVD
ncbi:MAG: polyamine aminopropyltransferase [Candidatus Cloacimonetes bacterium]|nr:polyamine aminopropyltransferase [Candidatus Cloacimonadota bacterium]